MFGYGVAFVVFVAVGVLISASMPDTFLGLWLGPFLIVFSVYFAFIVPRTLRIGFGLEAEEEQRKRLLDAPERSGQEDDRMPLFDIPDVSSQEHEPPIA